MNEKRKPYATIHISRSAAAHIVVIGLTAVAFAIAFAADFLQERRQQEAQLADLQDSLSIAEARASDLEEALHHSESNIRSLEATLREAEMEHGSNKVQLPMPLGFFDSSTYNGPELTFYSCAPIEVENSQVAVSHDLGPTLTIYRIWDRAAVRKLLDTGKYELVAHASWSTDWEDKPDIDYYMRKDVTARKSFKWPRHKKRNSAYWDWWYHMDQDCRRQA